MYSNIADKTSYSYKNCVSPTLDAITMLTVSKFKYMVTYLFNCISKSTNKSQFRLKLDVVDVQ